MMQNKLCVLVLGVGGNIGQGILKALQLSGLPLHTVGACISPLALGLYTTDQSYISPYYHSPHFLNWLIDICLTEKIDAILTGVEPILSVLAEQAEVIQQKTSSLCITSSPDKLLIAQDKWLTCQWLQSHGFHFPRFALASDLVATQQLLEECTFPLIAKPRFGRGGSGIMIIQDSQTLQFVRQKKDYLLQEYLGNEQSEYTAGTFTNQAGELKGLIIMKRELLEGTTYRAEVGLFPEVRAEVERIVRQLQPRGPCNFQLRLSNGKPVCFEINMRFSGTTPIKARFGFNEVQASLEHFILKKSVQLPIITQGIALRYWNEMYIDQVAYQHLCSTHKLISPKQYHFTFENYGAGH